MIDFYIEVIVKHHVQKVLLDTQFLAFANLFVINIVSHVIMILNVKNVLMIFIFTKKKMYVLKIVPMNILKIIN